jgi:hypothetical protein
MSTTLSPQAEQARKTMLAQAQPEPLPRKLFPGTDNAYLLQGVTLSNGHGVLIYELIDYPESYEGPFAYECQDADRHNDEGFVSASDAIEAADSYHGDVS